MNEKSSTLLIIPLLFPLIGSAFSLLEKALPKLRISHFTAPFSIIAGALCTAILYPLVSTGGAISYFVGGWGPPFGITLVMDGLAWFASIMVFIIAIPVILYAVGQKTHGAIFYCCFQLMIAAMIGLVLTEDIFNMFVMLEILALSAYTLVAAHKTARATLAALKYLLVSSAGISFFLIGIFILYRITGSLSLSIIRDRLNDGVQAAHSSQAVIAMICLLTGLGVRTAFVPFHTWLPEAHASAPHPVSAILSGIVIKTAFIAIWRITTIFNITQIGNLLVWTGAVTSLVGVVWALAQYDMKRLLAFHSISQIGYITAAFGAGTALAMTGSGYHIFSHAAFKSLLFLSVGSVVMATGKRDLRQIGNLGRKLPLTAIPFFIGAFAISGVPPFNGYVSKSLVYAGLKEHPAYPLLWITGILTIASFIKLSGIFRNKPMLSNEPLVTTGQNSTTIHTALWLLAGICLATGLAPGFFITRFTTLMNMRDVGTTLSFYTFRELATTIPVVLLGILAYCAVISRQGKKAAEFVTSRNIEFRDALLMLIGGFIIFSIITLFA